MTLPIILFLLLYIITETLIYWEGTCKKCGEVYRGTFIGMVIDSFIHQWKDRKLK